LSLGGRPDYKFRVTYSAPGGMDAAGFDGDDVLVTGPHDYVAPATLVSVRPNPRRGLWVVTYVVPARGGRWSRGTNGVFTIALLQGHVRTGGGAAAPGGAIGTFVLRTSLADRA
jgi:hypothetical protein